MASTLEHKAPLEYADLDVGRLRHLIWNGYADEAGRAAQLIRQMADNAIELNGRQQRPRLERYGNLVRDLEVYLRSNAAALIDYGTRYRRGLPIASSRAESLVNSLVNARMNKRRQMRWTPQGAHHVLQVRAACINGRLSAGRLSLAL
jgi:hypothetical protein